MENAVIARKSLERAFEICIVTEDGVSKLLRAGGDLDNLA